MKSFTLLFLFFIASTYNSQNTKTDPYFSQTRDTISPFGPRSITRNILEDTKGNIWLATWQGIIKYDGKVFTNYTLKNNLIHFHVYSIMEDKSGNMWFGTIRGGAYKYDGKNFTLYTTADGIIDDLIGCMMEDKTGNIWFGTDEGISCFDTSALHKTIPNMGVQLPGLLAAYKKGIRNFNTNDGLCGNRVNSIIQDKTGKIWIATRSGVCCYDGKNFTDFKLKPDVPFTNVRCIKEDRNGKIWIGGQEGLYCYDPLLTGEAAFKKVMPNFICYIFEDKAGNFWVSTGEAKGMALYKYDGKTFSKIIEKNKDGDSQVFEISEDKSGNIWFGTMNGCCRYNGKTFENFAK